MFKLQKTPAYWWPVTVKFPADGGTWEEDTFEVKFPRLDREGIRTIVAEAAKATTLAVLQRLVLDFKDVIAADGTALRHSSEALAQLDAMPGVAQAIFNAFMASHEQAALGN